jgi:hypothetical protein
MMVAIGNAVKMDAGKKTIIKIHALTVGTRDVTNAIHLDK